MPKEPVAGNQKNIHVKVSSLNQAFRLGVLVMFIFFIVLLYFDNTSTSSVLWRAQYFDKAQHYKYDSHWLKKKAP